MAKKGSGLDLSISIEGIEPCIAAFNSLEKELKKNANGELRAASKVIALHIANVMLPRWAGSTGSPQAQAFAQAAGAKSDRYVVVAVPSKKPKLSGARKLDAATAKRLVFAVEGGSDYPPFGNPAAGSLIQSHLGEMIAYAQPRYESAVVSLMRKYELI